MKEEKILQLAQSIPLQAPLLELPSQAIGTATSLDRDQSTAGDPRPLDKKAEPQAQSDQTHLANQWQKELQSPTSCVRFSNVFTTASLLGWKRPKNSGG